MYIFVMIGEWVEVSGKRKGKNEKNVRQILAFLLSIKCFNVCLVSDTVVND